MATEKRLFYVEEAVKVLRGKCVGKYPSTFMMGLFAAADEISKFPTVDAVEVVRCKDCVYYREEDLLCVGVSCVGDSHANWYPDDFCSYGERKDNE